MRIAIAMTCAALLASGCGDDAGAQPDAAGGVDAAAGADATSADAGVPDTDIAVVRFTAGGQLDTTFGTSGIAIIDVTTGAGTVRDNAYSVGRDGQDRIVVFGAAKAATRGDADRFVLRLTAGGQLDTSFGSGGKHILDTSTYVDNQRHGVVQPDGKILSAGYVGRPTGVGDQNVNTVSLLRLDANGAPDNGFGVYGVAEANPFKPADPLTTMWGMCEAYGAAPHGTGYVTTGYGRSAPSGTVDMVSLRFEADGTRDLSWGENGVALLDLVGENDRGRHLVSLADGSVVIVGSGSTSSTNVDAMVVKLTSTGDLDDSFGGGEGYKLYSFGRADEAFFNASLAPDGNSVAAVGYRAGATGGAAEDEDGLLLILPVSGNGAEVAAPAPASETLDDRFWGVAHDATGRIYAAGFINDGGDTRFAVTRFSAAGVKDTSFGDAGTAQVNVATAGTVETARAVVVQSDGKIVVVGHVERR